MNPQPVELACDESGYEGEKLIRTTTDVFAHASVRLDPGRAADCMRELRDRIRSPALEYKANHLLREKHRPVLVWLLGPAAPLLGEARVYLIDKAFFVVGTVLDVLLADDAAARTLYRERGPGSERWDAFLVAANDLMRAKDRPDGRPPVDAFLRAVDVLRAADAPGATNGILDRLARAQPRAESFRAGLLDHPAVLPALDPLIPAIAAAVDYGGGNVSIVHDQQNSLPQRRIDQLKERLGGRLAGLRLVDSRSDARVQVADVLAGVARKIASDDLNDRGDAQLTALLRPYVDPSSIWGDERSWTRLAPAPT
jgi:hypothetical protein